MAVLVFLLVGHYTATLGQPQPKPGAEDLADTNYCLRHPTSELCEDPDALPTESRLRSEIVVDKNNTTINDLQDRDVKCYEKVAVSEEHPNGYQEVKCPSLFPDVSSGED